MTWARFLDAELAEDRGDVVADRALADTKPHADRGVVEALRDQLDHLTLARREITLATHPPLAWDFRLGMRGSILNRAASMLYVGVRWTCMS